MEYDCVYEMNPLLPEIPHRDRLLIHKGLVLHPLVFLYRDDLLTYENMFAPMLMSTYVVHNNLQVINRAKQYCKKR